VLLTNALYLGQRSLQASKKIVSGVHSNAEVSELTSYKVLLRHINNVLSKDGGEATKGSR
jgi:hypothetical protein